jgi:hypothetical protein
MLTLTEIQDSFASGTPAVGLTKEENTGVGRAGSLWDVIARHAGYLHSLHNLLVGLEDLLSPNPNFNYLRALGFGDIPVAAPSNNDPTTTADVETALNKHIISSLGLLEPQSKQLGLVRVASRIAHVRKYLESDRLSPIFGDQRIKDEIRVLREDLHDDLEDRPIFFPDVLKFVTYYYKPYLFGPEVFDAFPDANTDILSAGNCYATDNDTACVLHCFRVAEYGLRGLTAYLWKRQSGQRRDEAIETASWGRIIGLLRDYIRDMNTSPSKFDGKPRRKINQKKRKQRLDFYSTALDSCVYFNQSRIDAAHVYRNGFKAPKLWL